MKIEFVTYNEEETIRGFRDLRYDNWKEKEIIEYCKRIAGVRKHKLKYIRFNKKRIFEEIKKPKGKEKRGINEDEI